MTNKIKLSVILPSLNVAMYIKECLNSVITQSMDGYEIICIDAGSTDGTWEILSEYADRDDRILLVHSEVQSYGYQVNEGISMARGEYIAIVETDDYIVPDAFKTLYEMAHYYDLDYIKGEYSIFVLINNKQLIYDKYKSVSEEYYFKVFNPVDVPDIFIHDLNIWRGLYKRKFLIDNNIKLNETSGAAFQDIGFVLQTMCYAKRVMYIPDCIYYYRFNREGCSSFSDNILKFVYQELEKFLTTLNAETDDRLINYSLNRFIIAFVCEYNKLLKKKEYDYKNEKINKHYMMFKNVFASLLKDNRLKAIELNRDTWNEFMEILNNQSTHCLSKKEKSDVDSNRINIFCDKLRDKNIVIVSCGIKGKRLLDILSQKDIKILAMCDNNPVLQETYMADKKIYSVEAAVSKFRDAVYVIATTKNYDMLLEQLIKLHINEEYIIKAEI